MGIDPVTVEAHILEHPYDLAHNVSVRANPNNWFYQYETDPAGTLRNEWQRYSNARKGHGSNNPLTMDDFSTYVLFWYGTAILVKTDRLRESYRMSIFWDLYAREASKWDKTPTSTEFERYMLDSWNLDIRA